MTLKKTPFKIPSLRLKPLRSAPIWLPLQRLLAALLIATVGPVAPLIAQVAAAPAAPHMLYITILDGEDSINNIRERTAREPIIQVTDQNHKPVAGALVVFSLVHSSSGADGVFTTPTGTASTFRTTTDAQGHAIAHGLQPNATAGQFSIAVEASVGSVTSVAVIHMINSLFGGTSSTNPGTTSGDNPASTTTSTTSHGIHIFHFVPRWAIIGGAVVVTATVVAVVVATRSSGATISAGTGGVTHP
jgi:hypothetical protein